MIFYKSTAEIEAMHESGCIVRKVLDHLSSSIKIGLTTYDMEEIAVDYLKSIAQDAVPAFKGYMGYPSSLCISLNSEVVHGIPSKDRYIKNGDVVSVDFGVFYKGYCADAAISVIAGKGTKEAQKLLKITEESLYEGIKYAKVGSRLHDISNAVQDYVEKNGFSVIRDFVGHGIGRSMHESPQVPNFGSKGTGILIKDGLTIAVEPMVAVGNYGIRILKDGWTAVTRDGSLSAHFEHTLAITKRGTIILTQI